MKAEDYYFLFSLDFNNKNYSILKSRHVLLARYDDSAARDYEFFKSHYREIINNALQSGLTSYRNKGVVRVHFKDSNKFYSVLLELDNNNFIAIKTVLTSNKDIHFTKVNQKINLANYVFNKTNKEVTFITTNKTGIRKSTKRNHFNKVRKVNIKKKRLNKDCTYVPKVEDELFLDYMDNLK